MLHRLLLLSMFAVLTIFGTGCATDSASSLREARPLTLGANFAPLIGGQYRINGDVGIDATIANGPLGVPAGLFGAGGFWGALEDGLRDLKETGSHASLGGSYYPIKSSAFRIGAGLGFEQMTVAFDADLDEGQPDDAPLERVTYKRTATFLSLPIGWHWIWDSGFSFSLNMGPNFRVSHKVSYTDEGAAAVDEDDRDEYRDDTESERKMTWGGLGYFGYSF